MPLIYATEHGPKSTEKGSRPYSPANQPFLFCCSKGDLGLLGRRTQIRTVDLLPVKQAL